jgi:FkbM family methyltransferase
MFVEVGRGVSREEVIAAFRIFLGRAPEKEAVIASQMRLPDWKSLADNIMNSPEFKMRKIAATEPTFSPYSSPPFQVYKGYQPRELEIFKRFELYRGEGTPGFVTNFLGVKISTAFCAPLVPFDGRTEDYPMPIGNVQAETAEFIGTLRSVLEARDRFTMLECGAGYGTWMTIANAAARQCGIEELHLHGIEGDAGHIEFISQHLLDNGIDPSTCNIVHGVVGAEAGVAHWAVTDDPDEVYGWRPMDDTEIDYLGVQQQRRVEVNVYAIADLLQKEPEWDLVHIDIQGGEGEVCRAGIEMLNERVRRVVIGTHSRTLDGELMSLFYSAGWSLENEKPTIFSWRDGAQTLEALTTVDGIQVWRNPRLVGVPAI